MGIDRNALPDAVLRRITPADRRAVSLPSPLAETVKAAADKSDLRREKELQRDIGNWLRLRGITFVQSRMDKKTRTRKGVSDFLFAIRGRAVALEAKLPGKQPTEDQRRVMAGLAADGWRVAVVRSLDEARSVVAEVEAGQ